MRNSKRSSRCSPNRASLVSNVTYDDSSDDSHVVSLEEVVPSERCSAKHSLTPLPSEHTSGHKLVDTSRSRWKPRLSETSNASGSVGVSSVKSAFEDSDLKRTVREVVRAELRTFFADMKTLLQDYVHAREHAREPGAYHSHTLELSATPRYVRKRSRAFASTGYYSSEAESTFHPQVTERRMQNTRSSDHSVLSKSEVLTPVYAGTETKAHFEIQDTKPLELPECQLLNAIESSSCEQAFSLLDKLADPNAKVPVYSKPGSKMLYYHCSLLAVAVMRGNVDMVRLLVEAKADVEDQNSYGFEAGSRRMPWTGSAIFAALPDGNLEMLREMIELKANPEDQSSNGANLVWQCSYFGHAHMLSTLVDKHGVSWDVKAESQNLKDIHYTPLHIAAIMDRENILAKLISVRAEINVKSEDGKSPLTHAIEHGFYGIVRTLVSKGAQLVTQKALEGEERPLDILFRMSNPVLVRNAAVGLHYQEEQVRALTIDDLLKFMSCSSSAKQEILSAMFKRRVLRYWSEAKTTHILKTAFIRRSQYMQSGQKNRFVNVAVSRIGHSDLEDQAKRRKIPEKEVMSFLERLAPQKRRWDWMSSCSGFRTSMTSIVTFEAMMPGFHDDLRILQEIAKSNSHEDIFILKPVQAILTNAWRLVWPHALFELIMHLALLVIYSVMAERLANTVPCGNSNARCDTGDLDQDKQIKYLASVGVPFVLVLLIRDVQLFVAYAQHGWTVSYFKTFFQQHSTIVAFLHNILSMFMLSVIVVTDGRSTASLIFRLFFATENVAKWLTVVYCIAPARRCGLCLMPILYTVREIWTIAAVFGTCIMAFFSSLVSLGLESKVWINTLMDVFLFGFSSESDYFPYVVAEYGLNSGVWTRHMVRLFLVILTFLVCITMMNCFIAAMTATYKIGFNNKLKLYQVCLAREAVKHMAVSQSFKRLTSLCRRKRNRDSRFLWYAIEAEE